MNHPDMALDIICSFLSQLGLTSPREPTSQMVAALIVLIQCGFNMAVELPLDELKETYNKVKMKLPSLARQSSRPHVVEFPPTPAAHLREYTATAMELYKDGPPVTCPFPLKHIAAIRQRIPMRKKIDWEFQESASNLSIWKEGTTMHLV